MAPAADLREWIALLERENELVRVDAEVDPHLENTEIVDRTVKANGPALLFTNPKDSPHQLLINQFGSERRMCMAFDAPSLDAVAGRLEEVLEMQPPQGCRRASAPGSARRSCFKVTTSTSAAFRSRPAGPATAVRSSRSPP